MAHLSYEWKIPPSAVLAEDPRTQITMLRYLRWRAAQANKG